MAPTTHENGEAVPPACAPTLIRRLRGPASVVLSLAVIALAVYGLHRALRHVDAHAVFVALGALTRVQIAHAAFFTACSFLAISGQEYFALRIAGRPLTFRHAAIGGIIAQAIGHSTGFSVAVGGGIRYRYYSRFGATWSEVAKVQASFSGSLALALIFQLAAAMLLHPALLDHAVRLSATLTRTIGAILMLAAFSALALTLRKAPIRILGRRMDLPPTGFLVAQVMCSVLDLAFLAAAAHALMPEALGASYSVMLGIAVVSLALGIVSSVPGGLGVFESSVLLLTSPPHYLIAATIGSLLAFRAFYYLVPLALGFLAMLILEAARRRRRRR